MLVQDRMTLKPVTIKVDASFHEAYQIMRDKKFRRLPVVDKAGKLVGIVTERDLLQASPSSATSLSVYEINYLLANLRVKDVMAKSVITVSADTPLEDAAQIMIEKKIGALPVLREGSTARLSSPKSELVGIITETDIFKAFAEVLGSGQPSLRVTMQVPDVPGELARLASVIAQMGGNIHSVAGFRGEDPDQAYITVRLDGVDEATLVPALEAEGEKVVHTRCPSQ